MKYNRDGTLYQLDTVLEAIEARCAKREFPSLSDLLGSDWDLGHSGLYTFTPAMYKARAIELAKQFYGRKVAPC